MQRNILFSILFLIVLSACKEDKDEVPPSILISSPAENTQINVLESIVIEAEISDNENLESIQVSLVSSTSGNRVLPAVGIRPTSNPYNLDLFFTISDSLLDSGSYYFKVEAFDKEGNSSSSFRFINLNGISKKLLGTIISCSNGISSEVYLDNNDFSFQFKNSYSSAYQASVFNNNDQHFWYVPRNGNQLSVYNMAENKQVFSETYNSSFNETFTGLRIDERDVLVSIKDGEVDGFNQSFGDNYTYQANGERIINNFSMGDEYIIVDEQDRTGTNRTLNVLRRNSGFVISTATIDFSLVDAFFFEEDRAILFVNNPQGGAVALFNVPDGNLNIINTTSDSILAVVKTNNNDYVLSTSIDVKTYRLLGNSLTSYLNEQRAVLAYNELSNLLYVGEGTTLSVYEYRKTNTVANTTLPSTILGINLRYNKN